MEAVDGVSACIKLTKFGQSDMPPAVISLLGIKWVKWVSLHLGNMEDMLHHGDKESSRSVPWMEAMLRIRDDRAPTL